MDEKDIDSPQKETDEVEPTLNFKSDTIKIGDDDSAVTTPVSELVPADHLLAHFPDSHRIEAMGQQKVPIEPGDNAHFDEENEEIYSTVAGYPKITKFKSKVSADIVTLVSIEPLFVVSKDKMKVSVALHPPLPNGKSLKNENLQQLLKEHDISYGIDAASFEEIVAAAILGEIEFQRISLAEGQNVGTSTDAYLDFDIEIGPIAGTILGDGSIDFRERRIMVGVESGQRIATKIDAVQGAPGVNVYGEETPAMEGRDLEVKILNDCTYAKETRQVTATKDGVLSVVNNNVIKVLTHTNISSDIDFETGNVESKNSITIQGSVQPGFSVKTGGDLKVLGSVMSGIVNCEGNLVVKSGVTGKNSIVKSTGDADILFIEQGDLECGGICVLRKQSYYSNIRAGQDIRCKDLGKIMGGSLIAEGNISVWNIGGENAAPAVIAAGVVASRLTHLNQLRQSVVDQQEEIIQWLQRYRGSSGSKKVKKMELKLTDTKMQLLRVNLVPGAGIYSRVAGPADDQIENHEDYSAENSITIEDIKIDVQGEIFAGTELRIGNRKLKLAKTVSARQFRLHPNGKRIIAVPVKK
jgi:uncharacterized protein (DUF342 family)